MFLYKIPKHAFKYFLLKCILIIPILLVGISAYASPNEQAQAGSADCSQSYDEASNWKTPLLAQSDLVGNLQFLSVPYPYRDIELAQHALQTIPTLRTPADFEASFNKFKVPADIRLFQSERVTTEFRDYSNLHLSWLRSLLQGSRKPMTDHEDVYQFVVDEGCANLTVWRLGVFQRDGRLTKIILRRAYDDHNFSARNIPFKFSDFDQAMRAPHLVLNAMNSLIQKARRDGQNEIEEITKILLSAGAKTSGATYLHNSGPQRTIYFSYVPTYIDFDAEHIASWDISIHYNPETGRVDGRVTGRLYGGIASLP